MRVVPTVPLVCVHVFLTYRTQMTQIRSPNIKDLRTRRTFLLQYLPYRTPKFCTLVPPRRTPWHRNIMAYQSSDLTLEGGVAIYLVVFIFIYFRGCGSDSVIICHWFAFSLIMNLDAS